MKLLRHIPKLFTSTEDAPSQAAQGRRERGVLRTRATEDAAMRRARCVLGVAIMVAGAAWLPATAQASEPITSFRTALVEANAPLGEPAASGIVQAAPSGESFTIETRNGSDDTVEVSPSTTYARANPVIGEPSPTLADLAPGDYVGISGPLSAQTIAATAVVISTPQAGGHPDLITSFTLSEPGAPEAAKNVIFNAPTGVFGNPRAITQCLASEFAPDQCPSDSQAGLITIRANYEGNPNYLLGTAPIFMLSPSPKKQPALPSSSRSSISRSRFQSRFAPPPTMASASPSKTSPSSPLSPPPS